MGIATARKCAPLCACGKQLTQRKQSASPGRHRESQHLPWISRDTHWAPLLSSGYTQTYIEQEILESNSSLPKFPSAVTLLIITFNVLISEMAILTESCCLNNSKHEEGNKIKRLSYYVTADIPQIKSTK